MATQTVAICANVPAVVAWRLSQLAAATGRTRSDLIGDAIRAWYPGVALEYQRLASASSECEKLMEDCTSNV